MRKAAALIVAVLTASPVSADDTLRSRASRMADEGAEAYEAGHYPAALAKYKAAFDLAPLPALLVNISRSQLRLRRCPEALATARKFEAVSPGNDAVDLVAEIQKICRPIKPDAFKPCFQGSVAECAKYLDQNRARTSALAKDACRDIAFGPDTTERFICDKLFSPANDARPSESAAEADKGANRVEPKSGLEFIHLPGGTFHFGCEQADLQCAADEKPAKPATVLPFWIGRIDVPVSAYARCVAAGACTAPNVGPTCNWQIPKRDSHPINCVDWSQATAFCQWIGGRLPSAKEWEYAAKGGDDRIYPWGNEPPDSERALFGNPYPGDGTASAESYLGGASKHGVLNMAGNVWQWTASAYNGSKNKEIRGGL